MKQKFKLVGMSRPNSVTLEMPKTGDLFNAETNLTIGRFNALFNLFKKGEWTGDEVAMLEYSETSSDGTPINATMIEVFL